MDRVQVVLLAVVLWLSGVIAGMVLGRLVSQW